MKHWKTNRQTIRSWIIHKLGGYTHREVFQKALEIAEKVHIREIRNGCEHKDGGKDDG